MKVAETKKTTTIQQKKNAHEFSSRYQSNFFDQSSLGIQKKSFFGQMGGPAKPTIQAKLKIGKPNDSYEKEADQVADKVVRKIQKSPLNGQQMNPVSRISDRVGPGVQRACHQCEKESKLDDRNETLTDEKGIQKKTIFESAGGQLEDEKIQRNSANGSQDPGQGLEARLSQTKGQGQPMDKTVRQSMEKGIGADFSGVRIHTNTEAVNMNEELGSHAFTHSNDIYFNRGKYSPDSSSGKHLLAHELTHTVQQNPDIKSKRKNNSLNNNTPNIQMAYYFAPTPKRIPGTTIHEGVLPRFASANSDLFVEVSIPGATAKKEHSEKAGVADFYKADKKRTIAIKFVRGVPKYLRKNSRLAHGGGEYEHIDEAAPIVDRKSVYIRKLKLAPTKVYLGDLKPGGSAEAILGAGVQIPNYKKGLERTKDKTNEFIKDPKNQGKYDKVPPDWQWDLTPSTISSLTIPKDLDYPSGEGVGGKRNLGVYLGNSKVVQDSGLKGSLYVYKDDKDGIWAYEYFPENIPKSIGHSKVDEALNRLNNDIIPNLQKKTDPSAAKNTRVPKIQAKKKFSLKNWNKKYYSGWKKSTKKILKNKRSLGKAPVAAALLELKGRSKANMTVPQSVAQKGKGLLKVRHWLKFGGLYGRLRAAFGPLSTKIATFFQKLKKRFKALSKKTKKPGGSTSGIIGAVVRVTFSLTKVFMGIITRRVGENLMQGLKKGAADLAKDFFKTENIDPFLNKIDELKKLVEEVENFKEEKLKEKVDTFLKPYEDQITLFNKVKSAVSSIKDIISIVKWGIRVIQCATPPLVGCLKLLLQELALHLVEKVVQSCWFKEKAMLPLFKSFDFFKQMPEKITSGIKDLLRKSLPLPKFAVDSLLGSIQVPSATITPDELPCKNEKLTKAKIALAKLRDKHGEKRIRLMIAILEKRGVGDSTELSLEYVEKIDKAMVELKDVETKTFEEVLKATLDEKSTKLAGLKGLIKELKRKGQAQKSNEDGGAKGGVKVVDGDKVGTDEELNGVPAGNITASVNALSGHTKGKNVSVKIAVFENGKHVALVVNVPAVVTKRIWRNSSKYGRYLKIYYRILKGIPNIHKGSFIKKGQIIWGPLIFNRKKKKGFEE